MKTVYTKRLTKKYCKRVADGLWNDKITPFYAKRAKQVFCRFLEHKYETVFRPWWYEQDWNQMKIADEVKKHTDQMFREFHKKTGIHPGMFDSYLKTLPTKKRGKIKKFTPRKYRQPVRKLKNPQEFFITNWVLGGTIEKTVVIGEPAFNCKGYDFFIYRDGDYWNVSDVAIGARICVSKRYAQAINIAKSNVERNFDKYVERVNKLRENDAG